MIYRILNTLHYVRGAERNPKIAHDTARRNIAAEPPGSAILGN